MKLWLLRARDGAEPWEPWYDTAAGFVIRAVDETIARDLAARKSGDEGGRAWRDSRLSTCVELTGDGPEGIVMRDFAPA